jgi:hypothetical protein
MNPNVPKNFAVLLMVAAGLLLRFSSFSQVSGVTNGCPGSDAQVYSVVPVPGAMGYLWMITPSSLGLIVSGQGTDAVEIAWNNPRVAQLGGTCGRTAAAVFGGRHPFGAVLLEFGDAGISFAER